jgi:hypothetical protein
MSQKKPLGLAGEVTTFPKSTLIVKLQAVVAYDVDQLARKRNQRKNLSIFLGRIAFVERVTQEGESQWWSYR